MTAAAEEPTDEQKNWVKKQMRGREAVKNPNGNGKDTVKKPEEIVHKYSSKGQGPLREAVLIAGIPYFIKKRFIEKRNEYVITVDPYIEEATKKLRPPFPEECPYIPYEFKTLEEPNQYLQRAKRETIDSLYQKVKSLTSLFNDIDEKTLSLLTADELISYFQDRCSTVHYLFILGDNGTGKTVFGNTFECLGYRAVNITNATEAFWLRIFGTNEAGQVTVIAEEFDRIDEKSQVMAMLKEGYRPDAKVPRMNNENTRMDFFLPFGIKIMIAEKSPSEDKAKGLVDRSLPIKTYKGLPDYDIKEIRNPQGNKQRQNLLDQIMDLRKLLLVYKLLHFNDPLPEVDIGLEGRDKELCKPLLQLFFGLGASKEMLNEIEKTLKHFLDIKNNRKAHSHEALIYPIIANIVSECGNDISTTEAWQKITSSIEGYFEKYVDKEGDEYIRNPNLYNTSDYGPLNRNTITQMICDKFGAELKHRNFGNVFIFDINHLAKAGKIYGETEGIQTKLVLEPEKSDSGDAGDAVLGGMDHGPNADLAPINDDQYSDSLLKQESFVQNNIENNELKQQPLRKSESPESPESPTPAIAGVKCQYCGEKLDSDPFYRKVHQCEDKSKAELKANPIYNCKICKKNHRKTFQGRTQEEYDEHMSKHRLA